jgi:putative spermidine/putrescine transport system substrate-binding protein
MTLVGSLQRCCAVVAAVMMVGWAGGHAARAAALEGRELYPGEQVLYDAAGREGLVVAGNLPVSWPSWAALARAFGDRYPDVTLVSNDLGSSAAVEALDRTRDHPRFDTVFLFAPVATDAASRGVFAPFRPASYDRLPAALRDPADLWMTVQQLPIVFLVNRKLVKTLPKTWADLKKADYKAAIVYSDPTTLTVGILTALAANAATGGTLETVRPGVEYFSTLHQSGNVAHVDTTASYGRFLRGEIPIWLTTEADALQARMVDGAKDADIVYPSDGTAAVSYAMALVKGARNENAAKLWLNFVLSDPGQQALVAGYTRPVLTGLAVRADVGDREPQMPRIEVLDQARVWARLPDIARLWPRIANPAQN